MTSTFAVQSLDRDLIHWEDHITDLSPVEKVGDLWFKREDYFAPLGYGHINGSKLRVCIWLIDQALKSGARGVIHGAVAGSPQHPMVAAICRHFGVPCVSVTAATDTDKHDTLRIAKGFGAEFCWSPVGYAKTLESKAFATRDEDYPGYFVLETNITVSERRNTAARIREFHRIGAYQSVNVPDHIDTVILPAGSCNSCVGALYGWSLFPPPNLKRVILCGIGNYGSKDPDYVRRRLQLIGAPDVYRWPTGIDFGDQGIEVNYVDCYTNPETGKPYCEYADLIPFCYHNSIHFHPRYEGKIWSWMARFGRLNHVLNDRTMFWIVGSEVNAA